MTRLIVLPEEDVVWYTADVERIVRVCQENGYEIEPLAAQRAWGRYSESGGRFASWLSLPQEDDELLSAVLANTVREDSNALLAKIAWRFGLDPEEMHWDYREEVPDGHVWIEWNYVDNNVIRARIERKRACSGGSVYWVPLGEVLL